ncbi:hypothetical protein EDB89DRAFT_1903640 [Lactarius sanguifluus]|nr:hypothetical protein EDB89DRAFT_1903640 [Lactarius sanguifluus]
MCLNLRLDPRPLWAIETYVHLPSQPDSFGAGPTAIVTASLQRRMKATTSRSRCDTPRGPGRKKGNGSVGSETDGKYTVDDPAALFRSWSCTDPEVSVYAFCQAWRDEERVHLRNEDRVELDELVKVEGGRVAQSHGDRDVGSSEWLFPDVGAGDLRHVQLIVQVCAGGIWGRIEDRETERMLTPERV